MAHTYKAVQWTPFKKAYDVFMLIGVAAFIGVYIVFTAQTHPEGQSYAEIQLLIRAFGAAAFAMLHLILVAGPLARLSPRFLPLLYNRRHMGVLTFLLALIHGSLTILWYQGFADVNPLIALFTSNPRYDSIAGFPFEALGVAALLVLFVMAATSHDFWNATLGPWLWKTLHMGVYVAYAALVAHVMLGAVQYEKHWIYAALVAMGAAVVAGLHLFAGGKEAQRERRSVTDKSDGWLRVGPARDIPQDKAVIVSAKGGERIAVFHYDGKVSAITNVCRHQGGPLGEGKIVDGCVTCPWHGFQYDPATGRSPPPFREKIATYRVKIEDGVVFVDPKALKPGTPTPPAVIEETTP